MLELSSIERAPYDTKTPSVPHWYMYPPKQSYSNDLAELPLATAVGDLVDPVNLYIHIPFCSMHCSFCTLFTKVTDDKLLMSRYIDTIILHASLLRGLLSPSARVLRNIFIGGGTPSILPFSDVSRLMEHIYDLFDCSNVRECSVELSPDAATPEVARAWRNAGFNRVSLGVQSFDDDLLRTMGRKHDGASAKLALKTLASAGFTSINADLIYGHAGQDLDDWIEDLKLIVASEASCVTVHPLAVRSASALAKRLHEDARSRAMSEMEAMYGACLDIFPTFGWQPVGAVFFSRDGKINQLERDEALGFSTLGLGVGARSYLERLHTVVDYYDGKRSFGEMLSVYTEEIQNGCLPALSSVEVGDEERARRSLVLGLMTGGASLAVLEETIEDEARQRISGEIRSLISEGLVNQEGNKISLSLVGLKRASDVGYALASDSVRKAMELKRR
jgi:oxygen-independent coproporphyrinogen-3 oxidase